MPSIDFIRTLLVDYARAAGGIAAEDFESDRPVGRHRSSG